MADLSEYRALDGIEFSPEVRKLMSLFAECWEECHADDCTTCKYRHGRNHYKLMYCLSERYAEKLIANDVAPVRHGRWEECDYVEPCIHGFGTIRHANAGLKCTNCVNVFKKELLWKDNYCPNCGAKMDKEDT